MTDKNANFNPRHRIIGAVILVVLGVLLLPMILRSPQTPGKGAQPNLTGPAASPENKVVVSQVSTSFPNASATMAPTPALTPQPSSSPLTPVPTKAAINTQNANPEETKQEQTKSEKRVSMLAAKETALSLKHVADIPQKGWFIQIGTYTSEGNARKISNELKGFPVRFEHIRLGNRKAVRVRVGPYAKNTMAQDAQRRIQKKTGEKGVLLSYK